MAHLIAGAVQRCQAPFRATVTILVHPWPALVVSHASTIRPSSGTLTASCSGRPFLATGTPDGTANEQLVTQDEAPLRPRYAITASSEPLSWPAVPPTCPEHRFAAVNVGQQRLMAMPSKL
jgi:hypothetical protein